MEFLQKLINDTAESGVGQAIIAFGAWTYVLILLLVTVFYALLCVIKSITSKKQ